MHSVFRCDTLHAQNLARGSLAGEMQARKTEKETKHTLSVLGEELTGPGFEPGFSGIQVGLKSPPFPSFLFMYKKNTYRIYVIPSFAYVDG
jgi:hypothetical protein